MVIAGVEVKYKRRAVGVRAAWRRAYKRLAGRGGADPCQLLWSSPWLTSPVHTGPAPSTSPV